MVCSMEVVFGIDLDGCPLPSSQLGLDRIAVGPSGFLDQLEERLGLPPCRTSGLDRILLCRAALEDAASDANRFFANSLAVDGLASARTLLHWRDELVLAGWDGATHSDVPPRIHDLAAVETIFRASQAATSGLPDRLHKILSALREGLDPGITIVHLTDSIDDLPALWRELLENLPATIQPWPHPDAPIAKNGTHLHDLQAALLGQSSPPRSPDDPPDESLRIIESPVLSQAATAAACLLANENNAVCVIGARDTLTPLNRALQERDQALLPAGTRNTAGALPQLAPLVLRLHWDPFDPQAWLEFLLHPISPLSRRLTFKLARTLNQTPSRRSPAWTEAIESALNSAADETERKRLSTQLDLWLVPATFSDSAPGAVLAETARKLATWMGKRSGAPDLPDASQWRAACEALHRLSNALASFEVLSRAELERLLAEWLPSASLTETSVGELGAHPTLASPAHMLEPAAHLLWWLPGSGPTAPSPWSARERQWLDAHQVTLLDPQAQQRREQRQVHHAILNTHQSVIFVHHPDGSEASPTPSVLVRVLAECGPGVISETEPLIEKESVSSYPLRKPCPRWSISDPSLLPPRDSESFSSLNRFLYSPWQWVLDYKARLRPGPLVDFRIIDDAKRRGSLLHGFVESLLEPDREEEETSVIGAPPTSQPAPAASLLETLVRRLFHTAAPLNWKTVSHDAVFEWIASEWPRILEEQAAHYLVPGNEASRSELLYLAKTGIWELIRQLREARIVSVQCEEKIEAAPFCGGSLNGFIDLAVTNEDGGIGVVDLKLGGRTYRQDELANGRHLQLAVYGHLLRSSGQRTAHGAYFIFSGGILLARSREFFPSATVVRSKPGVPADDWESCWQEFEALWQWRRDQIDQGNIEVSLTSFHPTLTPSHWTVKEPDRFNPYSNLTGWEATA